MTAKLTASCFSIDPSPPFEIRIGTTKVFYWARLTKSDWDLFIQCLEFHHCKADLDFIDFRGRTALTQAIVDNNFEVVCALIEAGADVNLRNDRGESPIDIAFTAVQAKTLDEDNGSIYHFPCYATRAPSALALLSAGANPYNRRALGTIVGLEVEMWLDSLNFIRHNFIFHDLGPIVADFLYNRGALLNAISHRLKYESKWQYFRENCIITDERTS